MRTKIQNCILIPGVDGESEITFVENAEVQVNGRHIVYAGESAKAPDFEAEQTIDGTNTLCMPGLVNLHTHTPMTFLRSAGADLTLDDWLHQIIFKLEAGWDDQLIRSATELGCMEMIRFGTTSFCDMYMYTDTIAKAVQDCGMRAMLGHGVVDFDESCRDLAEGIELIRNWNHACDDRIRVSLAPHAEYTTTTKLLNEVVRASIEHDVPIHIHISETKQEHEACISRNGMTPIQYFNSIGMLERTTIAAHCVWVDDEDIDLIARNGVTVAHNPVSNLKLASGIAPVTAMLEKGCKVALGTDGVASNNNLNLWEEVKLMPLLQKGITLRPEVVTPAQTLAAATSIGAKALGYSNLGMIKEGYLADLILVRSDVAHMVPDFHMSSNLIYALQGSDVVLTMVDGKVLYDHGTFTTMDQDAVLQSAREGAKELYRRFQAKQ